MANFDSSKWYRISTPDNVLSFVGTPGNTRDNKTSVQPYGPVFLRISNSSDYEQQWQLYPVNTSHVVMRTRASGPDNYLSAAIAQDDNGDVNAGSTKPIMGNHTLLDNSMYWSVGAWTDGLFWFENAQNGSSWHLNHTGHGFFRLSSNITAPQEGQRFKFTTLQDIDDVKYSSYGVPGTAATATASSTATPVATASSASPSSSSSSSSSSGLSTGAKAAIGAVIGAFFLLLLVLALLWLVKKRKRQSTRNVALEQYRTGPAAPAQEPPQQYSELPAPAAAAVPRYEQYQDQKRAELQGSQQIAELDGGGHWR